MDKGSVKLSILGLRFMMKKILITGGSGLVGSGLSHALSMEGHSVVHLSRKENLAARFPAYRWDPQKKQIDSRALEGVTDVIHLAGSGIADARWTPQRKQELMDSRTRTTELLYEEFLKQKHFPASLIGASAIGFYGAVTGEKIFTEADSPGKDFLAECSKRWENSYRLFQDAGVRTIILRIGVVISGRGGALKKLAAPVRLGAGAPLGTGKQFVPWIHEEDIFGIISYALKSPSMNGIFNAVAPEHCTNLDLTKSIAKTLKRPLVLPAIPALAMRILLGEMAVMLLEGSRVSCEKLLASGYSFRFSHLQDAIHQTLSESK